MVTNRSIEKKVAGDELIANVVIMIRHDDGDRGSLLAWRAKLQGQVFTFDIEPTQRQAFQG